MQVEESKMRRMVSEGRKLTIETMPGNDRLRIVADGITFSKAQVKVLCAQLELHASDLKEDPSGAR